MPSLIVRTCAVLVLIGGAALPLKAGQPDLATLRAEQLELRPQIEAGKGRYATVPKPQRERLLSRQAELLPLLEGKQDAASLSAHEQVAVRNALEALVAAEKDADDSRLVCKRSRSIGSHRITTNCRSAAQVREEEENARLSIDQSTRGCGNATSGGPCPVEPTGP